ncbi:MAG: outer membrane beta-barrel protein [Prevotellaceae bacterium]|jgi:hypothetical protein|nr:outer membrane beta-barrel protein [Prevotellaceae bacterium]
MKKTVLISSLLLAVQLQAQEMEIVTMPRLRLGIEAGVVTLFGKTDRPAMIRESRSYYYDHDYDFNCGFIFDGQLFDFFYFGLKSEYSLSGRFAVAAGIRFSYGKAELDSDKDYFLWKIRENETSANYVKINSITQKSYYIGIPLEVKIFPRRTDYFVRHYFIIGTALNFRLSSTGDVSFQNVQMEKYASDIVAQLGQPGNFQGYLYAGFGLKIGRTNHPFGDIEFHFPVYLYGSDRLNSFTKAKDTVGFGARTTLHIPIFTKRRLAYKTNN